MFKKLSNTKTLIAIASLTVLIITQWGIEIPSENIMVTIKSLCSIGVLLGVLNDNGMDTNSWNK